MIRGMVQRLADRLHADGSDVEAGCAWCAPMSCSAIVTRPRMPPPMAKRALSDHPDEVKRIDDSSKVSVSKADGAHMRRRPTIMTRKQRRWF